MKEPTLTHGDQQWRHGINQRLAARIELAHLAATLDDVYARIGELAARTQALLDHDL